MRKNPETILLAKIRRQIREAIHCDKAYDEYRANYHTSRSLRAKRVDFSAGVGLPYFSKHSLAIELIAKRIVKIVREADRHKESLEITVDLENWEVEDEKMA